MSYDPLAAAYLAVELTEQHATSAMPHAPVIPDRARRQPFRRSRAMVAAGLHRFAGWVEPAEPRRVAASGC